MLIVREVISGQYQDFKHRNYLEPHRRNYFSFFLSNTGFIRHSIDFKTYACSRHDIFFLMPHQVYLVETAGRLSGISISFIPEILNIEEEKLPVVQNICQNNRLKLTNEQYDYLNEMMRKMLVEYKNKEHYSENLLRSFLSAFLIYLSRLYLEQNKYSNELKRQPLVEKFRTLIAAHWKTHSHVADYARLLNISPGHLNHIVKHQTGRKAGEWIQEKKLLEAKRLLLHSHQSIKEIAYESGFEDPAYFNRFFKKMNHLTPLEFREEIRKKYNI